MANAINSLNYGDNTYTFTLPYGVCSTAADTAAKTVTVDNFSLEAGATVIVKFTYANSIASPTLNVNSTGAKPIYRYGTTAASTGTTTTGWRAGAIQMFTYDGTGWIRDFWENTSYSNAALGQGYATCATAAATTAKVGTLSSYTLATGGIVSVKFTYDVPASATLNINSKGAKSIYYRGAAITAGVIKAGDIATFIYSSQYHLISIDRWQEDIDSKQATITGGATTITSSDLTASRALISNSSGKVAVSAVTSTELGYLDGVTSAIQTQLDGKAASSHTHNYAGSSSAGGAATSANKINTDAGSATNPVYFSNGVPVKTTYTLGASVPSGAKFTDTTYSVATQSAAGLMSADDKKQIDNGGIPIATTAGTGDAYTATIDGVTLTNGAKITIIPHTASIVTNPTLNVNSLGAKYIRMPVTYNTSATSVGAVAGWLVANKPVTLEYDGTYWKTISLPRPSAQYLYGTVPIANGGTGATDAQGAVDNLVKDTTIQPLCIEFPGMPSPPSGVTANGGYIDFHYPNGNTDFSSRIIEYSDGVYIEKDGDSEGTKEKVVTEGKWNTLTLESDVTETTQAGNRPVGYRKVGNHVYVTGCISFTPSSSAILVATLPTGYRPQQGVVTYQPATGDHIARVQVYSNGQLKVDFLYKLGGTARVTSGSIGWCSIQLDYFVD